jgi:hypothetical protein
MFHVRGNCLTILYGQIAWTVLWLLCYW